VTITRPGEGGGQPLANHLKPFDLALIGRDIGRLDRQRHLIGKGGDQGRAIGTRKYLEGEHRSGLLLVFEEKAFGWHIRAGVEDETRTELANYCRQRQPFRSQHRPGP